MLRHSRVSADTQSLRRLILQADGDIATAPLARTIVRHQRVSARTEALQQLCRLADGGTAKAPLATTTIRHLISTRARRDSAARSSKGSGYYHRSCCGNRVTTPERINAACCTPRAKTEVLPANAKEIVAEEEQARRYCSPWEGQPRQTLCKRIAAFEDLARQTDHQYFSRGITSGQTPCKLVAALEAQPRQADRIFVR